MRVLVFGSSGFVGRHVARELAARGHEIEGWSRTRSDDPALARERAVDLSDARSFDGAQGSFDAAILLAGHAVPGPEFDARAALTNGLIARYALEHLARTSSGARVIVMSSAHVYGAANDPHPIEERHPPAPDGPYGASKLEVERLARAHADELDVVIVRSFNQIGSRMPRGLLIPDLLDALSSGAGLVTMRGPDGVRDFLDVRDGARAIADLVASPARGSGVFNLCSGVGVRVSDLARGLAERLSIGREVRFAPATRGAFVGSREALTRHTGWKPAIALEETLDWIAREAVPRA